MGHKGGPRPQGEATNIKVAVRARPLSENERARNCVECIRFRDAKTTVISEASTGTEKQFHFDFCYGPESTQMQVYKDLAEPIVKGAIDGFNGVVFAYGQTGSGKTHSMMGTGDDKGVVPLTNVGIFKMLDAKREEEGIEYLVTAAYVEIYNESVRDLLNPSEKQLTIREHPEAGAYVENLAEVVVGSAGDVESLLQQGNAVKQVASTRMNRRSSRSHCCFIVNIQQRKAEEVGTGDSATKKETSLSAKINLVDLAGSEHASKAGAQGEGLKEGTAIDQSLSTLGQVINMLAGGSTSHIPYRSSKLTRVLQHALGGNARTVMIAAVSPADYNYSETLSTLQCASRASKIKNQATRNEDVSGKLIRGLREEVERLKQQMQATQSEEHAGQVRQLRAQIAALEEAKQQRWAEARKSSRVFDQERAAALESEKEEEIALPEIRAQSAALARLEQRPVASGVQINEELAAEYRRRAARLEAHGSALADLVTELQLREIEHRAENHVLKEQVKRLQREIERCEERRLQETEAIALASQERLKEAARGFHREYQRLARTLKVASADCVRLHNNQKALGINEWPE